MMKNDHKFSSVEENCTDNNLDLLSSIIGLTETVRFSIYNAPNEEIREITPKIAKLFMDTLCEPDELAGAKVTISFQAQGLNWFGETYHEGDDTFLVIINCDWPWEIMILVLAHELTHVKQYLVGDLVDVDIEGSDDMTCHWQGVYYTVRKNSVPDKQHERDLQKIAYDDRPNELEAQAMERRLYTLYLGSLLRDDSVSNPAATIAHIEYFRN
jgi:hypothetical protein